MRKLFFFKELVVPQHGHVCKAMSFLNVLQFSLFDVVPKKIKRFRKIDWLFSETHRRMGSPGWRMLIPDKEHLLLQFLHFSKQINLHVRNVLFERKSDFHHQGLATNGDCLHTLIMLNHALFSTAADSTCAPLFVLKGCGWSARQSFVEQYL